jgi:hypothetical protein
MPVIYALCDFTQPDADRLAIAQAITTTDSQVSKAIDSF